MSPDPNVSRSVMDRLRNEARTTGEAFNPVLTRYVGFRLLYRLSMSPFRDRFFVKGATMFLVWTGSSHRATKDIDLLGVTPQSEVEIARTFRDLCGLPCPEDGVAFDPTTVRVEPIREGQTYGGRRVVLVGSLGSARIPLQVDIGFGDAVTPKAREIELPAMVRDVPPARLKGYPAETAIAEKLHALVVLGLENSRLKDFLDLAILASSMEFEAYILANAIRATFDRRQTELPANVPIALTEEFYGNDLVRTRWQAFVRRNGIGPPHDDLLTVIHRIERFLVPILGIARTGTDLRWVWHEEAWSVGG